MSEEKRQTSRQECRLPAKVHTRRHVYDAQVIDISEGGMCVSTHRHAEVFSGDRVEVVGEAFGLMAGTVRWRAFDRMGIRFRDCTDTKAKLESLRKQYYLAE